ncbi:hypothetical protein GGR39_003419 [Novosphingobium fluoreni]|uniref:Uncharacterized protein n=1 Tax=Novosphingobium fluoreni TaxID=1391222 RepID=A0A7W6C1G4_9SPHN|nr:hypothetical protein [Novosphingobium fluoreni]
MVRYLRALEADGKKAATLTRRIASVATVHRMLEFGGEMPPTSAPMVRNPLRANRCRKGAAQRQAISIDESVEFGCKAAPGTSHAMISRSPLLPVAPCWWTRMQVESIITNSPLKPADTATSSRSHTPALRQRTNRL